MNSTDDILIQAFAAQAVEGARNLARARKADAAGRPGEARRFRALADAQQLHADKALAMLARAEPDTNQAVQAAAAAVSEGIEAFQDGVMTAATERDPAAESALTHFLKAAMSHRTRLDKPAADDSEYHVCQVCGFLVGETVPERCPVCRAQTAQFNRID